MQDANHEYDKLEESVTAIGGEQQMRNTERMVILPIIDQKWREHLYEMDYLKEGIGLRAMAQRDPLVEYQKEGDLTSSVTTSGSVDTSKPGDYTVTYTVRNVAGMEDSIERTVHVTV